MHSPGSYEDGRGRKRFKGLPSLRDSQLGSQTYIKYITIMHSEKNVILIPLMYVLYMISLWPRTYPPGFGDGLTKLMNKWKVQPRLRQKREVNLDLSDREIFTSLPLGDVWGDADLVGDYKYFRNSNKSKIPNSWYKVFQDLDEEIQQASPN